jgi:hypothetical protein
MPSVFFTAFGLSFVLVRLVKGSWTRNPVYLVLSIFGGMAALLILMKTVPGAEDSFLYGNLAALGGSLAAILVYDLAT